MLRLLRRRRRASVVGPALLAELFLSLVLLAVITPNLRSMTQALGAVSGSARDKAVVVTQQSLIDTSIRDFAQDTTTPLRCANPVEAASAAECLTFDDPLTAPVPWIQADIDTDLDTIAGQFGGTQRAGEVSDSPFCFLSFGQPAGTALGEGTVWALRCMAWIPPSQYRRDAEQTLDRTGGLVFRTYQQVAMFDPLRPRFDVTTGANAESFIRGIAAFRMFWFDADGVVGADWASRVGCTTDTTLGCARALGNDPLGRSLPLIDDQFAASEGIRRVVLFLCPPDTDDFDGDGFSECVAALNDLSITNPADLEAALAGTGTFGYRYELIF